MASSYPNGLDTGFPGWPYSDNIEFVTAEQANAWVAAMQAIETTVGYGTGTSSPLYSVAYGKAFSTVAARIANVETAVVNGVVINTANGNIQSIGAANIAGNSGLAADAKHVHNGVPPAGLVPIGSIIMWPGAANTFPSGSQGTYFACNGQQISQATYSILFGLIGTTYGSGGGTFGLPNFNDRFPIGINSIASGPGSSGGSTNISTANLPAHSHPVNDPGHQHTLPPQTAVTTGSTIGLVPTAVNQAAFSSIFSTLPAATNILIGNTGSGAPYTPPWLGVYFLIRAL